MPTLKTVTDDVRHSDGTAWANAPFRFVLTASFTPTQDFPTDDFVAYSDDTGLLSVQLWANEEGEQSSHWTCYPPNGPSYKFTVPTSIASPCTLSQLRELGYTPLDPQYNTILDYFATQFFPQINVGNVKYGGGPSKTAAQNLAAINAAKVDAAAIGAKVLAFGAGVWNIDPAADLTGYIPLGDGSTFVGIGAQLAQLGSELRRAGGQVCVTSVGAVSVASVAGQATTLSSNGATATFSNAGAVTIAAAAGQSAAVSSNGASTTLSSAGAVTINAASAQAITVSQASTTRLAVTSAGVVQFGSPGSLSGAPAGATVIASGFYHRSSDGAGTTTYRLVGLSSDQVSVDPDARGVVMGAGLTVSGAISGVTTLTATTLAGTLSTAAQPNVTSVGTLTSLTLGGTLTFTPAASRIVPGATSFSIRNTANSADNFIVTNAGSATLTGSLTMGNALTANSKIVFDAQGGGAGAVILGGTAGVDMVVSSAARFMLAHTITSGSAVGEVVFKNTLGTTGLNAAQSTRYRIASINGSDQVSIDADGRGAVFGAGGAFVGQLTVTRDASGTTSLVIDHSHATASAGIININRQGVNRWQIALGTSTNNELQFFRNGSGTAAFQIDSASNATFAATVTLLAAASKVVPGATSFSIRNNADSADNFKVTNAGVGTLRSNLEVLGGTIWLEATDQSRISGDVDQVSWFAGTNNRSVQLDGFASKFAGGNGVLDLGASNAPWKALYLSSDITSGGQIFLSGNAKYVQEHNLAATTYYRLVGLNASDFVVIDADGRGVLHGAATSTGLAAGSIGLGNNVWLMGSIGAGNAQKYLIGMTSADRVGIDISGQGVQFGLALIALGGGAAPTLGTIGGGGPATGAQNSWMKFYDAAGAAFYVPAWK